MWANINDTGRLFWNSSQIWIFVNTSTSNSCFFLCKSSIPSSWSHFQEKKDKASSLSFMCCLLLCHRYYWCCNFWFYVNTANYNQKQILSLKKNDVETNTVIFAQSQEKECNTITRRKTHQLILRPFCILIWFNLFFVWFALTKVELKYWSCKNNVWNIILILLNIRMNLWTFYWRVLLNAFLFHSVLF